MKKRAPFFRFTHRIPLKTSSHPQSPAPVYSPKRPHPPFLQTLSVFIAKRFLHGVCSLSCIDRKAFFCLPYAREAAFFLIKKTAAGGLFPDIPPAALPPAAPVFPGNIGEHGFFCHIVSCMHQNARMIRSRKSIPFADRKNPCAVRRINPFSSRKRRSARWVSKSFTP